MGDIFNSDEVSGLLTHKNIAYIGDSFTRGLYKDLVWLINSNTFLPKQILGAKGEENFPDLKNPAFSKSGPSPLDPHLRKVFHQDNVDDRMDYKGLTAGRTYTETRKYYHESNDISVNYKFISKVWTEDLEDWFNKQTKLDFIIFNSTLWDMSRWGPRGPEEFKQNLTKLLEFIPKVLAPHGLFIWLTTPPCAEEIKSRGLNVEGLDFLCFTTRFNAIEANFYAAHAVKDAGFSVIDAHYYLQMQTFRRRPDGIHWSEEANRFITNFILTHISLAMNIKLPGRVKSNYSLDLVRLRAEVVKEKGQDGGKVKEEIKTKLEFAKRVAKEKNASTKREQEEIKENAFRNMKKLKANEEKTSKRNKFSSD